MVSTTSSSPGLLLELLSSKWFWLAVCIGIPLATSLFLNDE